MGKTKEEIEKTKEEKEKIGYEEAFYTGGKSCC